MGKFEDIVDRTWFDLTLYAESIPHLLHWDLAYLWILEKQQSVRPDKWKERVEAWKYLIALLLLDQLSIEEVPIDEPLINYTRPFGLESVSWVKIRGIEKPVGVLSPTVLVRPLPDYKRSFLDHWQTTRPDPVIQNPHDLLHLLNKAMVNMSAQGADSFAARLASCIRKEFNPLPTGLPPNTRPMQLPFLDRLGWSHRQDAPRLTKVQLFVKTDGDISRLWIPRCEECQALLTRSETDAPIPVESEVVVIPCPTGIHENQFNTSDFLVWLKGQNAILWKRIGMTSAPANGFPPVPQVAGSDVEFQWNPGPLDGEMDKRFLKLRFPNRVVLEKAISEITYTSILVPGALSNDFKGLPFRGDWLDAVSNLPELNAEVDPDLKRLTYRNVKLKGLPVEVDIVRGSQSITVDPGVKIGLYPNPHQMPPSWKIYRAFVAGPNRTKYLLTSRDSARLLPWVAGLESGAPNAFAVETADGSTGACFYNAPPPSPASNIPINRREIDVGIDFGTTNTLIYVAPPNSNPINIDHENFGIRPSQLHQNIFWLSEGGADDWKGEPIADFLPGSKHGMSRKDPYLIPTAVWESPMNALIRWSSTPPLPGMTETGNFKSDPNAVPLRFLYVRELMFLTVPQMIRQAGTGRSEIKLNLGFAFPLAFGFPDRREMKDLLQSLKASLEKTGCEADNFSISESRACVRAFGKPRLNENFLVADMGGGTLDLALFTTGDSEDRNTMHQIGSLRYAGENYVATFAQHAQEKIWKVRDAISSGVSSRAYGKDPAAQRILQRFIGFAFEYLRTMLAAFEQAQENSAIKLVLVGNGWHLTDAFSPDMNPRLFKERYENLVNLLALPGVTLYLEAPLPALPSSKHLVVIGALRNAWGGGGTRELNSDETQLSKLPAGRGMQLGKPGPSQKRFAWFDLVGGAISLTGLSLPDLKADSEFFLNEMPLLRDPWKKRLLDEFGAATVGQIPYPNEMEMREQVNVEGDPPKVQQGPLQVILEQSWIKKLDN